MAQINLLITVKGAGAEEATRLAMRLLMATKPVKTNLVSAGHEVTAKAAMPCECCGEMLVDVRVGLCPDCAGDRAVDRQLDDPVTRIVFPLQVAEAAVI